MRRVSSSAWAGVMIPQTGWLINMKAFPSVLEAGRLRSGRQPGQVLGENPLPGHEPPISCIPTWWRAERGSKLSPESYKDNNPKGLTS